MITIPIGIDCGTADYLKRNNIRQLSLPFDWCVTYNGITDIVKNNFSNFLPTNNLSISNSSYTSYTSFVHNIFPADIDTMNRRIKRFMDLLSTKDEELIFIKKGHANHNHSEALNLGCQIKNDIVDCEEFYLFLQNNYPKLKFKIMCIINCSQCFDCDKIYTSNFENMTIYNIITENTMIDMEKFEKVLSILLQAI